ncbi:MAG: FAD-dependent thymidylate synthase, partial [Armatimonadetes bacterium]|nr:FAD-dependent thymidylate synthase [Armatimonadota bacterium]
MARLVIPEAEELLDKELKVLDKGYVRLVDYLGGDARIVQSARVSYGPGTKTVREDRGLINYLMRNQHTSPFEQVILTFHCKMPIFVARQWVRHRTARLNEISARYSVMPDEFYLPESEQMRIQSKRNKQGRDAETIPPEQALEMIATLESEQKKIYESYEEMLEAGLARELARISLPVSLYTEWYWQIDLHNLFHFLHVRMDEHAQWEIREYAKALAKCAKAVAPMAFESWEEQVFFAVRFSRTECRALAATLEGREPDLD